MAIYHFHGKAVCRSKGHSAVAAAAYRAGEKLFDERRDRIHDYRPRSGVLASFILAPPQASAWMAERETLWNTCEAIERRKDSCVARELEVALPRELSLDAHIALVTGFVLNQLTPRGVVADIALHQGPARDGGTNPHAHILFTTRPVLKNGNGFGKKDRGLERRETLAAWRASWQDHINRALADAGETARVDHRTLTQQGSARAPIPTLNRRLLAMEQRGIDTEQGERWRAESHATGLLTEQPLTDTAAFLTAAAQMTPPQSHTHTLLTLASQALGRKG